jgi:hypothetical protein
LGTLTKLSYHFFSYQVVIIANKSHTVFSQRKENYGTTKVNKCKGDYGKSRQSLRDSTRYSQEASC